MSFVSMKNFTGHLLPWLIKEHFSCTLLHGPPYSLRETLANIPLDSSVAAANLHFSRQPKLQLWNNLLF